MKKFLSGLGTFSLCLLLGGIGFILFDLFVASTPLTGTLFTAKEKTSPAVPAPPHEEPHALVLSKQALQNIGIDDDAISELAVSSYDKTMSFPAMLVDRPGRSTYRVPAPFTGIIQTIHVEPGMVVTPGQPLFDLLLTHEDLIACQNELISLFQKRDTVLREMERLESLATDIAPKAKRDVEFQKAELDSQIDTQRGILRLHGIDDRRIDETIEKNRTLIYMITVRVPCQAEDQKTPVAEKTTSSEESPCGCEHTHDSVIQMESLSVDKGQLVNLGDPLCQLVDLALLNIEGRASSIDEEVLATALMEHCRVTAHFDNQRVEGLHIRYIDTRIDPVSRALRFYVELPNSVVVRDKEQSHHHPWTEEEGSERENKDQWKDEAPCPIHQHYVNWRFRPGQRCELKVEYDTIASCLVVPREAVAESGSEAFVFEWTGTEPDGEKRKIWVKRPVHVLHRGKTQVAVANDGSIFPGAKIAGRGAGQLLVALTSGGGQLQSTCPCGDH